MPFDLSLFDPAPGAAALDILRAALVVVLAVAQALAIAVSGRGKDSRTVGSRADRLENPVVPFRPAFVIWAVIFASSAAFSIWHALPANLADPLLRIVGWGAVALYGLNTIWEVWVTRRGYEPSTVAVSSVMLVVALWLLFATQHASLEGWTYALVAVPFAIFAGWLTAAVFVNTSLALRRLVLDGDGSRSIPDPGRTPVALSLIGAAAAIGIVVTFATGAWAYALTVAWALGGILIGNRRNPPIAAAVGAAFAVLIIVVLVR